MNPFACTNVALTYANDRHMDGAGAQLQRIYGIYAISRFLKLPYIHSPLKKIGYQGLSALESNSAAADFEVEYNRVFNIPSDIELPENPVIHDTTHADIGLMRSLQIGAKHNKEFNLVRILYPYAMTDQHPEMYRHVKAISPFRRTNSGPFRLALHVRRGEHLALSSDRMLPNSYFVSCALRIIEALRKLDISFVCELYTEVPTKAFIVTPQHHGIVERISADVLVDPQMNRLEDFDVIPNLVRFINGDPIETLRRMTTADALVLSRSSYSYVAAILSTKCIVVYHPFWHSPLKEWLTADANGIVPDAELATCLGDWNRHSSS